jgi:hypothetical protein
MRKDALKLILDEIQNLIIDYININLHFPPPKKIEWILCDKSEFKEYYNGMLLNDIPLYINGYYNYHFDLHSGSFRTYPISWGILEIIYDYGDKCIGLIRTDMPISYQIKTLIHATLHAILMTHHIHHINNRNLIKYYTQNVDLYTNFLENFEENLKKDNLELYKQVDDFYNILIILGSLSDDFLKDESGQYILDLSYIEDPSKLPQLNGDILSALYTSRVNNEIKKIINIFRLREMYSRIVKPIKILHEGFCSYYEEIIYRDLIKDITDIFKKQNIFIDEELIFTPLGEIQKEGINFILIRDNNLYFDIVKFMVYMIKIFRNPYLFGFFLIDFLNRYYKDYSNIFTLYDKNIISYLNYEENIIKFILNVLEKSHENEITENNDYINIDKKKSDFHKLIKQIIFDTYGKYIKTLFNMVFYEDYTKGKVNMEKIDVGHLVIEITSMNEKIAKDFKIKNGEILKEINQPYKDYVSDIFINEIHLIEYPFELNLNYQDTLKSSFKENIKPYIHNFIPNIKEITVIFNDE